MPRSIPVMLRAFAALTMLALLAGCGGTDQADGTGEAPRTVAHDQGRTEVPAQPKRVVVLDTGELDAALTLGVKPVGAVEALPGAGFPKYLGAKTDGIVNVGTIEEPNLERVASLRPDLILSNTVRHDQIYDELSRIAPTVFAKDVGVTWKENLLLDARALGREADAKRMLADYQQRARALRPTQVPSVSVVRFLEGEIRLYQRASFIGTILDDIGLKRPASQRDTTETFLETSPERIRSMDGDLIVYGTYGTPEDTPSADVLNNRLWKRLAAVRAGRVSAVSDDHWFLGIGLGAANVVLDDLKRLLARDA